MRLSPPPSSPSPSSCKRKHINHQQEILTFLFRSTPTLRKLLKATSMRGRGCSNCRQCQVYSLLCAHNKTERRARATYTCARQASTCGKLYAQHGRLYLQCRVQILRGTGIFYVKLVNRCYAEAMEPTYEWQIYAYVADST